MTSISVSGQVIKGDGLAGNFGYPTANLQIDFQKYDLQPGVYASKCILAGKEYNAVSVVQAGINKFEVHLLGYNEENFYDEVLEVSLIKKLSGIEKKEGDDLLQKIENDMKKVFDYFN